MEIINTQPKYENDNNEFGYACDIRKQYGPFLPNTPLRLQTKYLRTANQNINVYFLRLMALSMQHMTPRCALTKRQKKNFIQFEF